MFKMLALSIAFVASASPLLANETKQSETEPPVTAILSGMSFTTADADASANFYSQFLGFNIRRDTVIDSAATLKVYGLKPDAKLRYVVLVPAAFSKENPDFPGLSFSEISGAEDSGFDQNHNRGIRLNETVIAYRVTNIKKIEAMMRAAKVPVVVPLALSGTGRSIALTVLDPNGIRVQMYEFVEK